MRTLEQTTCNRCGRLIEVETVDIGEGYQATVEACPKCDVEQVEVIEHVLTNEKSR